MYYLLVLLTILRIFHFFHMYQLLHYKRKEMIIYTLKNFLNFKLYLFNAKVKLRFTKRVVRLSVLAKTIFFLIPTDDYVGVILFITAPIIVILGIYIIYPLEKSINDKYFNDAKCQICNSDIYTIGVTGSYGKTSVKNFLNTVINIKYKALMTPKSYNTPMGLSLVINNNNMNAFKFFIAEMGASKEGDIEELTHLVEPKMAIITEIGEQHLNSFKTIDNIIKTKFELVEKESVEAAFLNYDNKYIRNYKIKNNCNKITYGTEKYNDYFYDELIVNDKGMSFNIYKKGKYFTNVKTKVLGYHNVLNILSVIAVSDYIGLTKTEIKMGVYNIEPVENRLELKKFGNNIILDDSFNSNYKGFLNAIDVMKNFDKKKIIITPGLVEVDDKKEDFYKGIGLKITNEIDTCILVGRNGKELSEYIENTEIIFKKSFLEAFEYYKQIEEENILLIANDLPDNYL